MIKLNNVLYPNIFQSLVFKIDWKSIENLFMQDPLDKRAEIGKLGNHLNPTRIPRVTESRIPRKINMQLYKILFKSVFFENHPVSVLTVYSFNLFDLVFRSNFPHNYIIYHPHLSNSLWWKYKTFVENFANFGQNFFRGFSFYFPVLFD